MLEPRELLETIMIDFGLDPAGRSKPLLLRDLAQYLVDQRLAGPARAAGHRRGAEPRASAALEELRMLSNLETEKSKLLQIVLVGQPNLRDKLAAPELEQLRQRITVSYHLAPLDADETANYINHRLRRAALGAPLEFPRDVDRPHPRAQPRRAAHHQRHLRRGAGLRLRRRAAPDRSALIARRARRAGGDRRAALGASAGRCGSRASRVGRRADPCAPAAGRRRHVAAARGAPHAPAAARRPSRLAAERRMRPRARC